jgi:hypothetical protein
MEEQECNYCMKSKGNKVCLCMQQLLCHRIAWQMYGNSMILFLVDHIY